VGCLERIPVPKVTLSDFEQHLPFSDFSTPPALLPYPRPVWVPLRQSLPVMSELYTHFRAGVRRNEESTTHCRLRV
jgi:hypothetical protein